MYKIKQYYKYILLSLIITAVISAAAVSASPFPIQAASGDYSISNWQMKTDEDYYNTETGCTYIVSLVENKTEPIVKILYSAYQISMDTEDISVDDEGNILNDFALDNNDAPVNRIEVTNMQKDAVYDEHDQKDITFEVTVYEWCAVQFYVQWTVDEEIQEESSEFLYCTVIDSAPPQIIVDTNPVFQDGGYLFEYSIRADTTSHDKSSINSGFKEVKIYRIIDDVREVLQSYAGTDFSNQLNFYGNILVVRGEYFIEATDGVGNKTTQRIISIDYDINELNTIVAIENILKNSYDYIDKLSDELREKYVAWQILTLDETSTEVEIQGARQLAMEALGECTNATKGYEIKTINSDFVSRNIEILNFNETTFPSIIKGETATINIAFALYNTNEVDKTKILAKAGIQGAKKILAMNIEVTSNYKELAASSFETAVQIRIPLDNYKNVVAVSVNETDGQTFYNNLKIDKGEGWILVYLPVTETVVNLVIEEETGTQANADLRYLFLLFLLIPIGAGIFFAIKFKGKLFEKIKLKRKRSSKTEIEVEAKPQEAKPKV